VAIFAGTFQPFSPQIGGSQAPDDNVTGQMSNATK